MKDFIITVVHVLVVFGLLALCAFLTIYLHPEDRGLVDTCDEPLIMASSRDHVGMHSRWYGARDLDSPLGGQSMKDVLITILHVSIVFRLIGLCALLVVASGP
jgi:hypothetical protein